MRGFGRALLLRCPHCGGRGVFASWFRIRPACPTCHLRFERQEGFMLGSMTINTIVTFLAIAAAVAVAMVATWPDPPMWPVIGVGAAVAVVVPVAIYPVTVTAWVAVELAMRAPEPHEFERNPEL